MRMRDAWAALLAGSPEGRWPWYHAPCGQRAFYTEEGGGLYSLSGEPLAAPEERCSCGQVVTPTSLLICHAFFWREHSWRRFALNPDDHFDPDEGGRAPEAEPGLTWEVLARISRQHGEAALLFEAALERQAEAPPPPARQRRRR